MFSKLCPGISADSEIAIVRIEQLAPLPKRRLAATLDLYPNAREFRWVQEEPQNMGSWTFMYPRLLELFAKTHAVGYAGRVASASPATGSSEAHKVELARLLDAAFAPV